MKSGLERLLKNLRTINLVTIVGEVLEYYDKEITDLVREQLSEGTKGDGSKFDAYADRTIELKRIRGRILMGERIALIDTGKFWQSLISGVIGGNLIIDDKEQSLLKELESRYGDKIISLTKESRSKLLLLMIDNIQQRAIYQLKQ